MGRKRPRPNTTAELDRSGGAQNSQIDVFFEVPPRLRSSERPFRWMGSLQLLKSGNPQGRPACSTHR